MEMPSGRAQWEVMGGCTGDPAVPRAELRRDVAVIDYPPSSSHSDRALERWWTSQWMRTIFQSCQPLLTAHTHSQSVLPPLPPPVMPVPQHRHRRVLVPPVAAQQPPLIAHWLLRATVECQDPAPPIPLPPKMRAEEACWVKMEVLRCLGYPLVALSTLRAVGRLQGTSLWGIPTQGACRVGRRSSPAPHNLAPSTPTPTRTTSTITTTPHQSLLP